jgi:hypothetical protein
MLEEVLDVTERVLSLNVRWMAIDSDFRPSMIARGWL